MLQIHGHGIQRNMANGVHVQVLEQGVRITEDFPWVVAISALQRYRQVKLAFEHILLSVVGASMIRSFRRE